MCIITIIISLLVCIHIYIYIHSARTPCFAWSCASSITNLWTSLMPETAKTVPTAKMATPTYVAQVASMLAEPFGTILRVPVHRSEVWPRLQHCIICHGLFLSAGHGCTGPLPFLPPSVLVSGVTSTERRVETDECAFGSRGRGGT